MASLNRDLTQYEQDLLTYPRLCNVCLDGNQEKKCFSLVVLFWDSLKVDGLSRAKKFILSYTLSPHTIINLLLEIVYTI